MSIFTTEQLMRVGVRKAQNSYCSFVFPNFITANSAHRTLKELAEESRLPRGCWTAAPIHKPELVLVIPSRIDIQTVTNTIAEEFADRLSMAVIILPMDDVQYGAAALVAALARESGSNTNPN